jgi:uncharacterized damage-inducible protein DinB
MDQYLESFDRMVAATETLFRLVPDDRFNWAPREGMMTCGQQMLHMAGAMKLYSDGIMKGEWPSASMEELLLKNNETPSGSSALALRLLRRSVADVRQTLKGLTEEDLAVPVFAPQFGGKVPRWKMVLLFFEHHYSHKAELFTYLRSMGVPVGSKQLYFGEES